MSNIVDYVLEMHLSPFAAHRFDPLQVLTEV